MNQKKTLFIRIGSDKAGTVTLANLVDDNREVFRERGYYAPMRNCLPLFDHLVKAAGLDSIDIFDPSKLGARHQLSLICFDQLLNHPECWSDTDIFLTTETFWGRLTKKNMVQYRHDIAGLCLKLKSFFPDHTIRIILHLRRADLYYESLYKQGIKAGRSYPNGIHDLIRKNYASNCMALLLVLEECFGANNIIIRPFEKSQMRKGNFAVDMLSILGIEDCSGFKMTRANESLHRDLCETLIRLNRQYGKLLSNPDLLGLSEALNSQYAFPDTKYFLGRRERQEIVSEFEEFYSYIARHYRARAKLFQEEFPSDDHLNYRLSESSFQIISDLIFQTHAQSA